MQLFFIYYTLPQLVPALNIQSRFFAAWLAFTLNVAAYLAEIIRAAIESIDKGQMEASPRARAHPQPSDAPRHHPAVVPPHDPANLQRVRQWCRKDTSLVSIIALTDLTYQTKIIASNKASALVYIPAMIIYLIITGAFTFIFNRLEKRLSIYE